MLLFSLCLVLLSFVGVLGRGINFGIDLRGGLLLEFETTREPEVSALRSTMRGVVERNVTEQEFGSTTVFHLRVQTPKLAGGEEWNPQRSLERIKGAFPDSRFGCPVSSCGDGRAYGRLRVAAGGEVVG